MTLSQSSVNLDLTSANCDPTTKSFSVSGVARGRPRLPPRRTRHFERYWSPPDLSCFRQPRSPDPPDEDRFAQPFPSEKTPADDDVIFPPSKSRLLRRLLFSGRTTEAGKLSSAMDGVRLGHSEDSGFDSSTRDGSRTVADTEDDDLLVDVRRYRSLSRRDKRQDSCDVEELDRCPPTPPLAVFLSSEDITSTIFPSRPPSFHSGTPPPSRPAPGVVLRSTRRRCRCGTLRRLVSRTRRQGARSDARNVGHCQSVSARHSPSS